MQAPLQACTEVACGGQGTHAEAVANDASKVQPVVLVVHGVAAAVGTQASEAHLNHLNHFLVGCIENGCGVHHKDHIALHEATGEVLRSQATGRDGRTGGGERERAL